MIRITVGAKDLDLSPNTSIEWVRVNPLFEDEVSLEADRSYNFQIPKTPGNVLQLENVKKVTGVKLYVEGRLFMNCTLHVLGDDTDYYDVSLVSDIFEVNGERLITEVVEDEEITGNMITLKDDAHTDPFTTYPFVFPIIENVHESVFQLKAQQDVFNNGFHHINSELLQYSNNRSDILSPQFRFQDITRQICDLGLGLNWSGSFLRLENDALIYNPVILNDTIFDFKFEWESLPTGTVRGKIPSRDEFEIVPGDNIQINLVSFRNNSAAQQQIRQIDYTVSPNDIASDGKVDVLQFFTNFIAYINANFPPLPNLILNTSADIPYMEFSPGLAYPNIYLGFDVYYAGIKKGVLGGYNGVSAKNHLPAMTILEYLQSLKDFFCLSLTPKYDSQELVAINRGKLLQTNKYIDVTDKLLYGQKTILRDEKNLRFVFLDDDSDELDGDPFFRTHANNHPEHVADGWEEYSINAGTTNKRTLNIPIGNISLTSPYVKQEISEVEEEAVDFGLKFIRWSGIQNNSGTASNSGLTPNEVYNTYWKEWYDFIKDGVVLHKYPMLLSADDVLNFDPEKKWKIMHHMYLWKEIRTSITMRNGIGESEVQVAKVQYGNECVGNYTEPEQGE